MAKNDWYTFSSNGDAGYLAHKYGPDGNHIETYTLNKNGSACSCPAHVPFCRHKKMLVTFKDMERIDTGWQYNFDGDKWKEPVEVEGLDGMDPIDTDELGIPKPPKPPKNPAITGDGIIGLPDYVTGDDDND